MQFPHAVLQLEAPLRHILLPLAGKSFFEQGPSFSRVLKSGGPPGGGGASKHQRHVPEFLRLLRAGGAAAAAGGGAQSYSPLIALLRGMTAAAIDRELRAMQVRARVAVCECVSPCAVTLCREAGSFYVIDVRPPSCMVGLP